MNLVIKKIYKKSITLKKGYENSMHTDYGKDASIQYNEVIREATSIFT